MCDCRTQLEQDSDGKIKENVAKKFKGAEIDGIDFNEIAFPLSRNAEGAVRMRVLTISTLKVALKGLNKLAKVTILHSFCPFCGVKYD